MEINRKMISDTLIVIGIILVVIGWSGRTASGVGGFVSFLMLGIGVALGIWGLARYAGGHNQPKE